MTADHARFAEWDAAYVLGALSPADRARFEAHLAECDGCRAAIAEMAPVIGLLSRVDQHRAEALLSPAPEEGPDLGHRAQVIALGEARSRSTRRRRWAGVIAAAAAIVVAAVTIPIASLLQTPTGQIVALEAVADLPLTATVELTDVAWGTRLEMRCDYGEVADAPDEGWTYALVVTGTDGAESVLSTWRARPDTTARLTAGTALPAEEIAFVEIRALATGAVLMRTGDDGIDGE